MTRQNLLHHIATAIGFLGLMAWYLGARELGLFDWAVELAPEGHEGAGLMVGIMVAMTPGFFLWKLWVRWSEKKLGITGKYYEDGFYKDPPKKK
ncbi:hypothetical protein IOQ59_08090 [Pontibacterium sp. N1Y112]|uniref:Uncharacterized protein n=1 Tax=Pontibacterium sinense TaxID=2781979 RepID=A0A8J7FAC1_9GAMM|nr:hypothetical protein [Pontibacterium sinense]MBE9397217.1 hypothetical protein [Pontibacterium sinense]